MLRTGETTSEPCSSPPAFQLPFTRSTTTMAIGAQASRPCPQRFWAHADPALIADQALRAPRAARIRGAHPFRYAAPPHASPSPHDRWGTAGTERHLRMRPLSAAGPVAGAANY